MDKKIVVLAGDGIGPEVVAQGLKVMEAVNHLFDHHFEIENHLIGAASIDASGIPLTTSVIRACGQSDAILLGAIGDPKYDNDPKAKVRPEQGLLALRKELSLFSNVRPIPVFEGISNASPLKAEVIEGVDMLIFRELTGGLYFGEKTLSKDGKIATDSCLYSEEEIVRIARLAFEAAGHRRGKLTLVDKANVLETSRLWRRVVQDMRKDYPKVEVDFMFVDNAAMQLMMNPSSFDVILTENLFGDILSDLAGVITGSLGMLPSSSIGLKTALFEPVHGSYPQAAGKDIANPFATVLSVAMMYDYFELFEEARLIRSSIDWAIAEGCVTTDLNQHSHFPCSKVGDLLAAFISDNGELTLNKRNMDYGKTYI